MPTALLLVYNGTTLGAIMALYASRDLGMEMGGWLIIHGSTEFFAIILSGAAGIRIGWSVVFPGELTRLEAATKAGREAAIVMGGVVIMLAIAGLLEGFGRQLITSDAARYRHRPRPPRRLDDLFLRPQGRQGVSGPTNSSPVRGGGPAAAEGEGWWRGRADLCTTLHHGLGRGPPPRTGEEQDA